MAYFQTPDTLTKVVQVFQTPDTRSQTVACFHTPPTFSQTTVLVGGGPDGESSVRSMAS